MEELAKLLKALVQLQVEAMFPSDPPVKPEVLLSRVGLTHAEIAQFLGKNAGAVAKTISRAK